MSIVTTDSQPTSRYPFTWGERTYVMGIINLSPDSFSHDGLLSTEAAVVQATRLVEDGADIIDVGGASTRPGAPPVSAEEETERVVPVIAHLHQELRVPISVDTYKYDVARAAIAAGVDIINDIQGLRDDNRLAHLVAKHQLSIIVTANQRGVVLAGDIMAKVMTDLRVAMQCCRDAGVPAENILIDPGLGFGKTAAQDLDVIRRLSELKVLSCPIVLGPSRKSFIGLTLGLQTNERLGGTAAAVALGIAYGADVVRVHDVKEMVRVVRLSDAIVRGHS